ncbi:MAG: SurA N-terminal domain-containing protein, partial [Duncaniella sp.]|nr:SurA N-terminal domain-containing protein [Duncaniella sp.]
MATLEKIRSKSVLLLIIVGAALLAFIIGDFFTSGRTLFGTGTTIAKVGDQKVDIHEFQNRVQQASQQAQQSGQRIDNAVLQQQVLDAMIAEKLFNQEIADLGITVTDAELTEMMVGKNSAYVDRMVQQQLGMPDAATAHDMAFNPTKYGLPQEQAIQLQQYWIEMEQNIEKMLLQQKFQTLFNGLIAANKLDAKALYDENTPTANIVYAKKDYSSLNDDEYAVETSAINALYNSEKNRYALSEPVRLINYIAVNITPSREDVLAGQKKVEDAILALNEQPDVQGIADMPEFVTDRQNIPQADVDRQNSLKAALDSMSVGRAALVSKNGNTYNIAKLLGKSVQSDKVVLDFMAVQGTREQIDSLTALLNNGASFDSIAASPLVAQSQKAMDVSLIDPNSSMIKELIADRATGVY